MTEYTDFFTKLAAVRKKDGRYKDEAYLFVMAALARAVKDLAEPRHVTGPELLGWIQEEAEEQFGPMAVTVFEHWGVKNSLDFGHIVFNMVQEGILSKTESDSLEDFRDAVFIQNLFDDIAGYRLDEKTFIGKPLIP
jgi:uncharacterized repeat protein (TIGR04138 family)